MGKIWLKKVVVQYAKQMVYLMCAVLLFLLAYQYKEMRIQREIAAKILRFHVIANSNLPEDQALKLKVRDQVGQYMSQKLEDVENLSECMAIANENLRQIESVAKEKVKEEGYDYEVEAKVGKIHFPEKTYGEYSFPEGNYEALEVVIGEGKGRNWWCVVYPNMCFSNTIYEVIDEEAKEQLEEVLTAEELDAVMKEGVEVKFFGMEKFRQWRNENLSCVKRIAN